MKETFKATGVKEREYEITFENQAHSQGTINGEPFDWDKIKVDERIFHIIQNAKSYTAEVVKADHKAKTFTIKVNNSSYTIQVKDRFDILLDKLGMSNLAKDKVTDIKAPMPGMVLDIHVKVGQEVSKDDPILVLEAMKMENMIKSPCNGVIKSIKAEQGIAVEKNSVLVTFE